MFCLYYIMVVGKKYSAEDVYCCEDVIDRIKTVNGVKLYVCM